MSVVLSVADLPPEHTATLPLAIGLAVVKAIEEVLRPSFIIHHSSFIISLKWPNDVLVDGKKIAGILCERNGDNVIVGIGVNVGQTEFPPEIADRATSLASLIPHSSFLIPHSSAVMWSILKSIDDVYARWKAGFAAVYPEIQMIDCLKGRTLSVRQTDDDVAPVTGVSNGIMPDGSLDVGGTSVYAGEAHVELGR